MQYSKLQFDAFGIETYAVAVVYSNGQIPFIQENAVGDWGMSYLTHEAYISGLPVGDGRDTYYFSNIDDAIQFKLRFG